jgi:hypothetical protein
VLSQLSSAYYASPSLGARPSEGEEPTPDPYHGVVTGRCRRPGRAAPAPGKRRTAWKILLLRRRSMQTGMQRAARRALAGTKSDFAGCVVQWMPNLDAAASIGNAGPQCCRECLPENQIRGQCIASHGWVQLKRCVLGSEAVTQMLCSVASISAPMRCVCSAGTECWQQQGLECGPLGLEAVTGSARPSCWASITVEQVASLAHSHRDGGVGHGLAGHDRQIVLHIHDSVVS